MREGKAQGWKRRAIKRVPPRSSIALHPVVKDDSGPVLTKPPSCRWRDCLRQLRRKILLHLSLRPPKFLGIQAPLLFASAPLSGPLQHSTPHPVGQFLHFRRGRGRSPTVRLDSSGDSINCFLSSETLNCSEDLNALKHLLDRFRL